MSVYEPINAKLMQTPGKLHFKCPGCREVHSVRISTGHEDWGYNGNPDAPTFMPSLLVTGHKWMPPVTPGNLHEWQKHPWKQEKVDTRCHSSITDGQIQFLADCTHELANQTVPIPDWEAICD